MKKKLISAWLAFSLAFGCVAVPVSANYSDANITITSETYTSGDYKYALLSDNTAKVTQYIGAGGIVNIPDYIDGYEVTVIGNKSFRQIKTITEIVMPDTITSVEYDSGSAYSAFTGCENLEAVTLSDNLIDIPYKCFQDCSSLDTISIPGSVKSIGYCAFDDCKSLRSVIFSSGVKKIDTCAFSNCTSLNNVELPNLLSSIGGAAFRNCKSLSKITIPISVTSIYSNAFENITDIVTIYCYKDSEAHKYAEKNKINYVLLDSAPSKKSISSATVSVSNVYYTGKALKPAPTVNLNGKKLTKDADYTVSYKNNVNYGKATVKITGKGNYTGSKSKNFIIKPGKVKLTKVISPKKKKIKLTWTEDKQASGYQVVIAANKSFTAGKKSYYVTKNGTVNKTYKLSSGKKYFVKVRVYKNIDGKKYFGKYSVIKSVKCK